MKITRSAFGASLPVVPGAASIATIVLYLADWPRAGNRGLQLAIGLGVAVVVWILTAILFGPEWTSVESASARTYEELRGRVKAARARLQGLQDAPKAQTPLGKEALAQSARCSIR
jgi:hypothetical protein